MGPADGDVTKVLVKDLHGPVDFLVSGPPCPPWAGGGLHKGQDDMRADVFVRILAWLVSWIKSGWLIGSVIENVLGTLRPDAEGNDGFMVKVRKVLTAEVPEFSWDISTMSAVDYLLPQNRQRAFLRGMRVVFCGGTMPAPVPPLGSRKLTEVLLKRIPNTDVTTMTESIQTNIAAMEKLVHKHKCEAKLKGVSVVVFHADRNKDKTFSTTYMKDCCPTLTTNNRYLFVLSVPDILKPKPKFRRLLEPKERLLLQGFDSHLQEEFDSDNLVLKATGNAYPVPLIGACLAPMVQAIAKRNTLFATWPVNKVIDESKTEKIIHKITKQKASNKDKNKRKTTMGTTTTGKSPKETTTKGKDTKDTKPKGRSTKDTAKKGKNTPGTMKKGERLTGTDTKGKTTQGTSTKCISTTMKQKAFEKTAASNKLPFKRPASAQTEDKACKRAKFEGRVLTSVFLESSDDD